MDDAGEHLTPRAAAEAVARMEGLNEALTRRTSGLTWMVWGIVGPAIFVTYSLAGAVSAYGGHVARWLWPLLWVPWTLMGVAATFALWRSAGLVLPLDEAATRREGALSMGLFLAFIFAAMALVRWLGVPVAEPGAVLGGLGLVSLAFGLTGWAATDATERRLWLATGVALLATTAAASLALAGRPLPEVYGAWAVVGPVASGVAFFGSGLLLVSRG